MAPTAGADAHPSDRDAPTRQIGWADVTDTALGALLAGAAVAALLWWRGWIGTQRQTVANRLDANEKKSLVAFMRQL